MRVPPTADTEARFSTPRAGLPTKPQPKRRAAAQPGEAGAAATRVFSPADAPTPPPTWAAAALVEPQRPSLRRTRELVFRAQGEPGAGPKPHKAVPKSRQVVPGVIALADTDLFKARKPADGEGGRIVNGLLQRPAPKNTGSDAGRPKTASASMSAASCHEDGTRATPSCKSAHNNIGVQTDSPLRWVAGRGATDALSPMDKYRGGVAVNSKQPTGPFVHGEDVRFIGPKKRGGIVNASGIKALTASGRLMGSEVRAWWPDEAPADDGYVPSKGETIFWQTSPFAVGRGMDVYDRRTFAPNMSNAEWLETCKELKYASTKLSEMERSLRKGMLERSKALSREEALAAKPFWAPSSRGAGSAVSDALSLQSTHTRATERLVSAGPDVPGYVMGGSLKVDDWLSPRRATPVLNQGPTQRRKDIPDYDKLERGARLGDSTLKAMRGQEVLNKLINLRDNPPKFDHTNRPTERPHAIRKFRYHGTKDSLTHSHEVLVQKRVPIPEDELKSLTHQQSGAQVTNERRVQWIRTRCMHCASATCT